MMKTTLWTALVLLQFALPAGPPDEDEPPTAAERAKPPPPFGSKFKDFAPRENKPVPRDARGRIVVNDGYHDGPMIEKLLRGFAKDYPAIASLETIGRSCQGRPLLALRISGDASRDKPALLFAGAHHANELMGTEAVLDIIEQLTTGSASDREVRQWVDRYAIWCIPLVNPDGLHRFFHVSAGEGRKNGRDTNGDGRIEYREGVDLNRNYPFRWHTLGEKGSSGNPAHGRYRGSSPASEPEVQAVMRLAERERFVMLISYHTSGSRVLVPYTIDGARDPYPNTPWIIGAYVAALSDAARPDRRYIPVHNLYTVDGVDQDWHYWRYGTLAYIWELSKTNPPYKPDRDRVIAGARPGWRYMLRRLAEGPTLSGHVLDRATGKPLEAVVSFDEIKTYEKESHTSHPATGRFDRVLPIEGVYHLRAAKEGYRTEVLKVTVGRTWEKITVRLTPSPGSQKKPKNERKTANPRK
jgi:hypothetical protein